MKTRNIIATYVGSTILTLLLIPEILTVIKNKSAKDLSYLFLSLHIVMGMFFLVFNEGIYNDIGLKAALPGFISNSMSIIFSLILIGLKHNYENKKI